MGPECTSTMSRLEELDKALQIAQQDLLNGSEDVFLENHLWAFEDNSDVSDFSERLGTPAQDFPFQLDDFQKRAILQLKDKKKVFVAAHTSAGKTAVAEYAIALAAAQNKRTFYTSPIKSLSNQKLKDFRDKFDEIDVGLLTGDFKISSHAECVIMTTEILRSTLHNNEDDLDDVEFVVFDEVHYLNDPERGTVWEECIMLLPARITLVMLSATVPNALEFAEWVGRLKRREVVVVVTENRPVPLEHTVLIMNGIVDASMQSDFHLGHPFQEFPAVTTSRQFVLQDVNPGYGQVQISSDPVARMGTECAAALMRLLLDREETPAVVFCFSKAAIDDLVMSMFSEDKLDLLPDEEDKKRVRNVFAHATARLEIAEEDQSGLEETIQVLQKGYGAHHAGLLPIQKEIAEMLFSMGLVQVLFSTETFAVGVNMPVRAVVFDDIRKYEGAAYRFLKTSEYTQMSGRAGRRGIDSVGKSYILFQDEGKSFPSVDEIRRMTVGRPEPLHSSFRLTYSVILNSMKHPSVSTEEWLRGSFMQTKRSLDWSYVQGIIDEAVLLLDTTHRGFLKRVFGIALNTASENRSSVPFCDTSSRAGPSSSRFSGTPRPIAFRPNACDKKTLQLSMCSGEQDIPRRLSREARLVLQVRVTDKISDLLSAMREEEKTSQENILSRKSQVLQGFGFVGENGKLTNKGRLGCLVNTVNAIYLTETVLSCSLEDLTPVEIAGLFSCFLEEPRRYGKYRASRFKYYYDVSLAYNRAIEKMFHIWERVTDIQNKQGVIDEEPIFTQGQQNLVQHWADGWPMSSLVRNYIQAGGFVVYMRRLCELMKEAQVIAREARKHRLYRLVSRAIQSVNRDAVSSDSLYF